MNINQYRRQRTTSLVNLIYTMPTQHLLCMFIIFSHINQPGYYSDLFSTWHAKCFTHWQGNQHVVKKKKAKSPLNAFNNICFFLELAGFYWELFDYTLTMFPVPDLALPGTICTWVHLLFKTIPQKDFLTAVIVVEFAYFSGWYSSQSTILSCFIGLSIPSLFFSVGV